MKILLHTDYYSDFQLVETDDLKALKKYVLDMVNEVETEYEPKVVEGFYNMTLAEAMAKADDEINIDDADNGAVFTMYENMALSHAERYGIYDYELKGHKMVWYSYYGSEGYYKVTCDFKTHEEVRKHLNSTKHSYNYFVG